MSRIYWHSRGRTAELLGAERAWLDHVSRGPAEAAWDFDASIDTLRHVSHVLDMVPEHKRGYLGDALRAANDQTDFHALDRLKAMLKTHMRVNGFTFEIAGHEVHSFETSLNTALALGADPIRLAAKIHGGCEIHMWIDEPHQPWLADIIDDGLYIGVYRQRAGWQDVQGLLREPDTGPVVMSFSVSDGFPNRYIADWTPPEDDPDGDSWYDLPRDEQWDLAMAKLREKRYLELSPDTLSGVAFGPPVTVYDLLAPDRDERIERAFSRPVVSPGEQP